MTDRPLVEFHRWESPEWHAFRADGTGASEMAAILGISPWASQWSLWADKLGLLPKRQPSDKMEFGHRIEPVVADWFAAQTGLHVARPEPGVEMMCANAERPWLRATPDGAIYESEPATTELELWASGLGQDPLGGFEMKFDSRPSRWPEIPAHYQAQGQAQMAVTGWERVWFAVLHGWHLEVYQLDRDQADIDLMIERADAFWHGHVLTGQPPEPDSHDATARAIAAVYPGGNHDQTIELDPKASDALRALAAAKAMKTAADTEVKALTNTVKAAMGDAYEATIGGERAATLGTQTRKTTCQHCGAVDESDPFRVLRPSKEIPA